MAFAGDSDPRTDIGSDGSDAEDRFDGAILGEDAHGVSGETAQEPDPSLVWTDAPSGPDQTVFADAPTVAPELHHEPPGKPVDDDDIETLAQRRARRAERAKARRRRGALPNIATVIVGLMIVAGAVLGWRSDIVRWAPQTASFYAAIGLPVNLRGLEFTDVKTERETQDGMTVLVVDGSLVNVTSRAVEVPRLRFAIRNPAGGEIYAWTAVPARALLGPGETMPFRSRLASPPAEGRDIQVRFFSRRDLASGLR